MCERVFKCLCGLFEAFEAKHDITNFNTRYLLTQTSLRVNMRRGKPATGHRSNLSFVNIAMISKEFAAGSVPVLALISRQEPQLTGLNTSSFYTIMEEKNAGRQNTWIW